MPNFPAARTVMVSGPALPVSPVGEPALQLSAVHGNETLSEIYAYTLDCLTPPDLTLPDEQAANLDLKAMIGKELTVTVQLEGMGAFVSGMPGLSGAANIGEGKREISGIVTGASFEGQLNRQCRYRLTMQPWIYLADQRSDYRIFQNRTVEEIVDEVLNAYSYSYDKRLSGRYPKMPYQVQYGETDFAFIQRLMQEHGIYWFFEHSNKVHRMVLVDHLGAHKPVESAAYRTLRYYPPGHKIDMEYIDAFNTAERIQPGRWTTSDFDFEHPKARLGVENALPQDTAHNGLERYEWPGDYTDPALGEHFARVRMEEVRAQGERASGGGNVRDVVCGTTFTLEGHPHAGANREYLVLGASFSATETEGAAGPGEYRISTSFAVQPATTVFRPPRTVRRPRTRGPQTAVVTGPPGQEIWTDQYGRVKLKFHWDRSPVRDQNSSCWVRVSYAWAGNSYGGINIPRVGSEVIVDFENGDPDRPIVTGQVYNALHMPPWALPDNATQSGMLSRTPAGSGENANMLRFEDKAGEEQIKLHAERNYDVSVERDSTITVGRKHLTLVGLDLPPVPSTRSPLDRLIEVLRLGGAPRPASPAQQPAAQQQQQQQQQQRQQQQQQRRQQQPYQQLKRQRQLQRAGAFQALAANVTKALQDIVAVLTNPSATASVSTVQGASTAVVFGDSTGVNVGHTVTVTSGNASRQVNGTNSLKSPNNVSLFATNTSLNGESVTTTGLSVATTGASIATTGMSVSNTGIAVSQKKCNVRNIAGIDITF
ncbi:type IV secretion protein Rhs [Burkholderia mayonis]|uniref:Type IV secretion protein Rhs n=1 Tax=Burkholderia mayonis TaxID=1385591 RepID=A0A1B4FL48_9BURK|nr:type VI secretion system tip protein TssI/VgrG [Burkholderia mayonis]AOJ04409.1 type IV secretion protein Rhs [Burkholderia mayonis]KVE41191.1 type IV secretion protein Rhs [Burkholderia mayonis]